MAPGSVTLIHREELEAFASIAARVGVAVHLYALNPVATLIAERAPRARYEQAYALLKRRGLLVRMSSQARIDANGGCGTLVALRRATPARPTQVNS